MGGGRHGGFGVDFYVGSNGGVLAGRYKGWIGVNRRDRLLKKAKNPKLRNAINQLYKPGSFIGDGGTASVLKFEKRTGVYTGHNGNSHFQKAEEMLNHMTKKVLKENLSPSERKLSEKLVKSLKKSLVEWRS